MKRIMIHMRTHMVSSCSMDPWGSAEFVGQIVFLPLNPPTGLANQGDELAQKNKIEEELILKKRIGREFKQL